MQLHVQKAALTYDDFYDLPHDFRKNFEYDHGNLVRRWKTVPSYGHQRYAFWLAVALDRYSEAQERDRHFVITEGDCRLITTEPKATRVPDVSLVPHWRVARKGPYPDFLRGAPDLAIEVKSKRATEQDVMRKVEEYLSNGGRVVWVVSPNERTLTVYRAGAPARVLTETDDVEDPDLLPGFRYPLRRLFEIADSESDSDSDSDSD
jgi:Uma2 family endonuclease